ncbi:hypothetical protein [Streptomyces sp. NRRL B-1347]|uniref:hypothetical protein n=1 Tax=Streptomyces sp. NRRL B-1347 TaxID=1476877 RepID=UPI0004CBC4FB|nr:hypothetical protein [Streptomyces sp. NRRL B-1347]
MTYVEGDDELSSWLHIRCATWEVEPVGFLRRLSVLLFVSCHSLLASQPQGEPTGPEVPLVRLKDTLRNSSPAQIFAALRNDSTFGDLTDVQELWIISTATTNVRALYWSRLRHAATEILAKTLAREGHDCTTDDLVKPEHS